MGDRRDRGAAGGLGYGLYDPAPWPLARRRLHFTTSFIASLKTNMNFLFFLVDPHAGALGPLGVGGFKGLRPLPPTPRKRSRSRSSGVSNESRRPFANSAKNKNMFTWRCVKTPRNSVSADGPVTTVKSKCSRRCWDYVSLSLGFVIFGGGVKWTGVKWIEVN